MRSGNRGFFLPLLLVVASIVLLLAVQRMFFARHTLLYTVHLANHEVAYQAALGGLKAGRARVVSFFDLFNEGRGADPAARKGLEPLFDALVDAEGELKLAGADLALPSDNLRAIEKAVPGLKLEARAILDKVSTIEGLPAAGSPSGPDGPKEKSFRLRVAATGTYEGIKVSLAYVTEGRRVFTHLPLYSKFTLYVRSAGDYRLNAIHDSEDPEKVKWTPMVLDNGRALGPAELLKPDELAALVDDQGFVHLGGAMEWRFGLGTIGRNPQAEAAGIRRDLYLYDIPAGLFPGSENFQYYAQASGLYRETRTMEAREFMALAGNAESSLSSLIDLYGPAGAPSPTLVVGDVKRNYILEQGILRADANLRAAFPFLPEEGTFASRQWPGQNSATVVGLIHDTLFGGKFEGYRARMSQPVVEQYNRGLHAFVRKDTLPADQQETLVLRDETVAPLARVRLNDGKVSPDLLHKAAGSVTLRTEKGETVYAGDLAGPDLATYLNSRVCYIHRSAKDFAAARLAGGKVAIQGVEKVLGDLALGEGITLAAGSYGILVAEGDIRIGAPIAAAAGHLYLVSLNGNIAVETGGAVHAYLAAPNGTITLPDGFEIDGGMMMGQLSNRLFPEGKRAKKLAYDPRLDPTRSEVVQKGYKLVVRKTWDFLVE